MKDNGGQAFPYGTPLAGAEGMTLRDYFAGQALAGMSALDQTFECTSNESMATLSYQLADAMIEERNK